MKTTLKYFANALSSTCRVIVALITVTVFISDAIAGPSGRFIRSTNSPRANAMGGADLLLTDQESVFNNPSSMALYHLNTYFSATFPLRTEWMPTHTDDYRITALSASIATPVFSKHNQVTSIGFSYYKLHYGTIVRTDGSGNVTGFSKLFEDAFELSVGLAKRGSVNLGFGANIGYLRVGGLDGSTLQLEDGNHLSLLIDIAAMAEGSFQPNQSPQSRSDFRYRVSALITPYSQKLWYVDKADASPGPAVFETGVGISAEFGNPMLRAFTALAVFQHEIDISSLAFSTTAQVVVPYQHSALDSPYMDLLR